MPTPAELDAAMLRPGRSVPAVNRLGGGAVAMAGADQPWRLVGRSAAVYQLRQPSGHVLALRCPLAEAAYLDPTLGDRYRALGADPALASLRSAAGGPLVDSVAYVADGLVFPAADFRSRTHPVMAMEWVMGPTVLAAADRGCRADDRAFLAALADAWAAAVAALAAARFSHGDLVPDNALVRPDGIGLVDYDASVWPGSPRLPAPSTPGEQSHGGSAPGPTASYAHPAGPVSIARRDDFPALVVYASLRLLARWPALREQHGDPPGRAGGALLFAPRDLRDPDASPLFGALRVLDDQPSRLLLGVLRQACQGAAEEVPPLADVAALVRQAEGGAVAPRPRTAVAAPA